MYTIDAKSAHVTCSINVCTVPAMVHQRVHHGRGRIRHPYKDGGTPVTWS